MPNINLPQIPARPPVDRTWRIGLSRARLNPYDSVVGTVPAAGTPYTGGGITVGLEDETVMLYVVPGGAIHRSSTDEMSPGMGKLATLSGASTSEFTWELAIRGSSSCIASTQAHTGTQRYTHIQHWGEGMRKWAALHYCAAASTLCVHIIVPRTPASATKKPWA